MIDTLYSMLRSWLRRNKKGILALSIAAMVAMVGWFCYTLGQGPPEDLGWFGR